MIMETDISSNIRLIRQRMGVACARCGRIPKASDSWRFKNFGAGTHPASPGCGCYPAGENYVQEAREKIPAIGHVAEWHMIGHLQTNKVKYVVNLFDWIHSVDRLELARELDKRAGQNNRRLNVLIEVNVSGEESKSVSRRHRRWNLSNRYPYYPI